MRKKEELAVRVEGLEGGASDAIYFIADGGGQGRVCLDCVHQRPHTHVGCNCVVGPDGVGRTLTGPAGRSQVCPNHPGPGTQG